jgi:hypothetical protein
MKRILNVVLFALIALTITQNHVLIAFALVVWFTYRVGAILLIPLAIIIDGYFGAFYSYPTITLVAILWYAASEFVRPQLLVQYKKYEEAS